jgi:hypothetical protein
VRTKPGRLGSGWVAEPASAVKVPSGTCMKPVVVNIVNGSRHELSVAWLGLEAALGLP